MPLSNRANASAGMLRTIDVGAITSKQHKQYSPYTDPLPAIRAQHGYANFLSITNMCLTVNLKVRLNYDTNRDIFIPGGSIITITDTPFDCFDLFNVTTNTSAGDEVYIIVGYQNPGTGTSLTGLK